MQGLESVVHSSTKIAISKIFDMAYKSNMYKLENMEDVVLFTAKRVDYPNIGTDVINIDDMTYLADNIFWINVCLFVNDDFRACFDDAITIEKALLQVNDQDYEDFRDEMILDNINSDATKSVPINLASYNTRVEQAVIKRITDANQNFFNSGMTDVYDDLTRTFDATTGAAITHIIHNMIYVINAFSRNGVFKKYVTLVVDSVKTQLQ